MEKPISQEEQWLITLANETTDPVRKRAYILAWMELVGLIKIITKQQDINQ